MKRFPRFAIASILAVAALLVPGMLAAAKELVGLTVSGPGMNGVLTLNNAQGLLQLQQYGFFGTTTDTSTLSNIPRNLGQGYTVAGYLNLDGNSVPFVQGVYYPAVAGQQGYIHFTGGFDGATMKSTNVDRWAVVSPEAAAAFSQMLAAQGVTLQPAVGVAMVHVSAALPAAPALPFSTLFPAMLGSALALVAGGLWMKRRQATVRS